MNGAGAIAPPLGELAAKPTEGDCNASSPRRHSRPVSAASVSLTRFSSSEGAAPAA